MSLVISTHSASTEKTPIEGRQQLQECLYDLYTPQLCTQPRFTRFLTVSINCVNISVHFTLPCTTTYHTAYATIRFFHGLEYSLVLPYTQYYCFNSVSKMCVATFILSRFGCGYCNLHLTQYPIMCVCFARLYPYNVMC